jgi:hypothetical protein
MFPSFMGKKWIFSMMNQVKIEETKPIVYSFPRYGKYK